MEQDLRVLRGERLEALLLRLPDRPGVYLMKDLQEDIIYVGKAKSLKSRVRSYFRASGDRRPFVSWLDSMLGDIEVILTPTERAALVVERDLIGKYRPRYNIDWRDDKNFLSIRITDHKVPRLMLDRRRPGMAAARQGGQWFGPYTSAAAAREAYGFLQKTFKLRSCADTVFAHRDRPCLLHQLQRCLGPCSLPVSAEEYRAQVDHAASFLRGRSVELIEELGRQMAIESGEQRYEQAARLRDGIRALERSLANQQVLGDESDNADVVGWHREGSNGILLLLQVRAGRWFGTIRFPVSRLEAPSADVLRQFLEQHYGEGQEAPPRILLPTDPLIDAEEGDDWTLLESWISENQAHATKIEVPKRGRWLHLVHHAQENAQEAFRMRLATTTLLADRLERLRARLGLSRIPHRIDCFDMSTLGGTWSVGAMSVMVDGETAPSLYRRYRIREAQSDSDVAMMREVVQRRLRPVLEGKEEAPDLMVLDGGLSQLNAVSRLFDELQVTDVDLVALGKGGPGAGRHQTTRERVFVPNRKNPILLRPDSDELFLLSRGRDEAHRFAGAYHRALRKKAATRSALDEIPGVGTVLRRRLLRHFGSLKALRQTTAEKLAEVPGVSRSLSVRIAHFLQKMGSSQNRE